MSSARRSFLRSLGTGITIFGAAGVQAIPASAQSPSSRWQSSRHPEDDWLDQIPGQHRLVFDTTDANGMNSALTYASNFYIANDSGYGLKNGDLAVVIVARHFSTPFAYNETVWSKYGEQISKFID